MGNCFSINITSNFHCKKCSISIKYYSDYKSISNSCRIHNFQNGYCADCLCKENYCINNCIHRWV